MPHQQPVIDGFDFASAGASREGDWPLGDFPRLRDMLASDDGKVHYAIAGVRDARGRPGLRIQVSGMLQLRCQRCLEPMAFEVRSDQTLVLAGSLEEIDAEPVDVNAADRVVAGREMPVRDLIEDELILAAPYAPRHESCSARPSPDAETKPSPFAGLRGLLDGKH
ncbi:MAG TPA: YceD family protein [Burkholderiales bacterium]|nr:YceD family protein [Burkholderiales bacterium]